MDDILFEWDKNKNKSNISKHGISFKTAALVFEDPNRIEFYQNRNGEDRFVTIGMVEDILCVVYTMRGEVHRIISARPAEDDEKEAYYGEY